MAKSVYLSADRFDDASTRADWRAQLAEIASSLSVGSSVEFEPTELQRLVHQKRLVESVPVSAVLGAVGRLFLPGVLFLTALWGLVLLLRSLN